MPPWWQNNNGEVEGNESGQWWMDKERMKREWKENLAISHELEGITKIREERERGREMSRKGEKKKWEKMRSNLK